VYRDDWIEASGRCGCGGEDGIVLLARFFGLSLAGDDDESALSDASGIVESAYGISADGLGWGKAVVWA
jgi:hypothetical protein